MSLFRTSVSNSPSVQIDDHDALWHKDFLILVSNILPTLIDEGGQNIRVQ